MKKLVVIASSLLLVLAISGLLYRRYLTSPSYSLIRIQRAIQQHDVTEFEKYVDLDSVSTRALTELPDIFGTQKDAGLFGEQTAEIVLALVKEPFVNIIKQAVRTFIERGHFDKALTEKGSLSKLFTLIPADSIQPLSLQQIRQEGKICRAPLTMHIGAFDGNTTVEFMLRNKGSYWQVAEVSNLSEFVHELLELQRTYPSRNLKGTCLHFAQLIPQQHLQAQALVVSVILALHRAAVPVQSSVLSLHTSPEAFPRPCPTILSLIILSSRSLSAFPRICPFGFRLYPLRSLRVLL